MRIRSLLSLLALLMAAPCAGCAAAPSTLAEDAKQGSGVDTRPVRVLTTRPARAIYTAGGRLDAGRICAVAVQPGPGQRYVLLLEWIQAPKTPAGGRSRLTRIDLTSGKAQQIADLGDGEAEPGPLVYAANGRVAVQEEGWQGEEDKYRIRVREPNGQWRPATEWTLGVEQEPVAWSPDSSSLVCHSYQFERKPSLYAFSVSTLGTKGTFAEKPMSDRYLQDVRWSADGSRLFARGFGRSLLEFRLLSIEWPSDKETELLTGPIADMEVAEESGTIVVSAATKDDRYTVWRIAPGGKPQRTPVTLSSVPMEFAVSPDGRYLAVVLGETVGKGISGSIFAQGGLEVYDLDDATEYRVPDTVGKNIMMVHWVSGGRALVFTIVPNGALDWESRATGKQLWFVEFPGSGPDGRRRSVELR